MADDSDYGRWKAAQKNVARKSIREHLQSIDNSLVVIKRIAIGFAIALIIGAVFELLAAMGFFPR